MDNNNCIITELEDGEFVGIDIFEVSEVPDISILVKDSSEETGFSQKLKKEFETLLTEFFFRMQTRF